MTPPKRVEAAPKKRGDIEIRFKKGHVGLVSPEAYARAGQKISKRMQEICKGKPPPWLVGKGFKTGHRNFRTDESYSNKETRKKLSIATSKWMLEHEGKNEKSRAWKGEDAGYDAFHLWLKNNYGKANKCEMPGCVYPRINKAKQILLAPKAFNWSLIHGKVHGHFRENYWMLCISCHMRYDGVNRRT